MKKIFRNTSLIAVAFLTIFSVAAKAAPVDPTSHVRNGVDHGLADTMRRTFVQFVNTKVPYPPKRPCIPRPS